MNCTLLAIFAAATCCRAAAPTGWLAELPGARPGTFNMFAVPEAGARAVFE